VTDQIRLSEKKRKERVKQVRGKTPSGKRADTNPQSGANKRIEGSNQKTPLKGETKSPEEKVNPVEKAKNEY